MFYSRSYPAKRLNGRVLGACAVAVLLVLVPWNAGRAADVEAAIAEAFKSLGFEPQPLPIGLKDPALARLEAHQPEDLKPGGKVIQVLAAIYPNETDARDIIERLTRDPPRLPGQKEAPRKKTTATLAGGEKATIVLEAGPRLQPGGTTAYAYGSAMVHFACGNVSVRVWQEALSANTFDCKREQVPGIGLKRFHYKPPEACSQAGWGLAGQNEQACRALASRLHQAIKSRGACHATRGPSHFAVPMRPPRPITSEQVDDFLDELANLLLAAADAPPPRVLTPLRRRVASASEPEKPRDPWIKCVDTWHKAAELARSVYEQSRAVQTQANRGIIPLTTPQKERLKAFIHWAHWIMKRDRERPVLIEAADAELNVSEGPGLYVWMRGFWARFPDAPKYPLFEVIRDHVDPPPLREIVDADEGSIFVEEYAEAFLLTIAQYADMYFTYGLLSTAYLYYSGAPFSAVALTALCAVPYAGPVLVAGLAIWTEVSQFQELTWDQHYGNLSAIFLSGFQMGKQLPELREKLSRKPAKRADPARGLNEAAVPASVPDPPARDYAFKVKGASGQFADLEASVPGRVEWRPPGDFRPAPQQVEVVKVADKELYFHKETGEPIIPPGEEGYTTWGLLTGRKCGQPTGETHLLQVFKGTKYEGRLQEIVQQFMDKQGDRRQPTRQLVRLMNEVLSDQSLPRTSGFSATGARQPAYATDELQIKNGAGEVHALKLAIDPEGKLADVIVLPPGPDTLIPLGPEFKKLSATARGRETERRIAEDPTRVKRDLNQIKRNFPTVDVESHQGKYVSLADGTLSYCQEKFQLLFGIGSKSTLPKALKALGTSPALEAKGRPLTLGEFIQKGQVAVPDEQVPTLRSWLKEKVQDPDLLRQGGWPDRDSFDALKALYNNDLTRITAHLQEMVIGHSELRR